MDYEKKYKEALERAKHTLDCDRNGLVSTDKQLILSMFPELKESEDEKTRKELLEYLQRCVKCNPLTEETEKIMKDSIAWLEKQCVQKPIISNNALREGIAHFGITQCQIDNWLKKYVDVEKQGEQKEKQYITITQKILDYIGKYESSFENGIPKLGDSWKVMKISKYQGVNGGEPVVKVVNEDNGDWMRLPLNIIDI